MTSPVPAALRRILVVKLSSLGDIVHVTPCLRALRRACPNARIIMAVDRRYVALVRHSAHLDEVIEADAGQGPQVDLVILDEIKKLLTTSVERIVQGVAAALKARPPGDRRREGEGPEGTRPDCEKCPCE